MCKMNNVTVGIKKLDFSSFRGKMAAFLTDGRQIIVPLSFFPEIKNLSLKQRSEWMILVNVLFPAYNHYVGCKTVDYKDAST